MQKHIPKALLIVPLMLIIALLSSCAIHEHVTYPEAIQSEQPQDSLTKTASDFSDIFLAVVEDAQIVDYALVDLDKNGKEDYLVLYSYTNKSGANKQSCVAVVFDDGLLKALDVAADKPNFVFSQGTDALSIDDGVARFYLLDTQAGDSYIYGVEFAKLDEGINARIEAEKEG